MEAEKEEVGVRRHHRCNSIPEVGGDRGSDGGDSILIKPLLRVEKTEKETQIEQQKAVLKALDEKAKGGEITLKDIYEQNKLIIEMLQEMLQE